MGKSKLLVDSEEEEEDEGMKCPTHPLGSEPSISTSSQSGSLISPSKSHSRSSISTPPPSQQSPTGPSPWPSQNEKTTPMHGKGGAIGVVNSLMRPSSLESPLSLAISSSAVLSFTPSQSSSSPSPHSPSSHTQLTPPSSSSLQTITSLTSTAKQSSPTKKLLRKSKNSSSIKHKKPNPDSDNSEYSSQSSSSSSSSDSGSSSDSDDDDDDENSSSNHEDGEDSSDSDDDDRDDYPLSRKLNRPPKKRKLNEKKDSARKKLNQKSLSSSSPQSTPSCKRKGGKSIQDKGDSQMKRGNKYDDNSDDDEGGGIRMGTFDPKKRSEKGALVASLLRRWWYALPTWPPPDFDYSVELEKRKLKEASLEEYEDLDDIDQNGYTKVYQISAFPGVFRDPHGVAIDLRPAENRPCYSSFMQKDDLELLTLLNSAIETQLKKLEISKYDETRLKVALHQELKEVREKLEAKRRRAEYLKTKAEKK